MKKLKLIVGCLLINLTTSFASEIIYQSTERLENEQNFFAEIIYNSVPERPFVEEKTSFTLSNGNIAYRVKRSGVRITRTDLGLEKIEDFDFGTKKVMHKGKLVEPIVETGNNIYSTDFSPNISRTSVTLVVLQYDRFNINVEETYFNSNESSLLAFFDEFALRFDMLEAKTGWSCELFYGEKLQINITTETVCWRGTALPTDFDIGFSDPFGTCPLEIYLEGMIHESLHAINPEAIYFRRWLTEGWSQYEQYNVLVNDGIYTQSQADSFITSGNFGTYTYTQNYLWNDYESFDYKDALGNEIQESAGYDITAWMLTMMRNDHGMDFTDLYYLIEENHQTLSKAESMWDVSDIFKDMVVIDLFGRAVGMDFDQIKDVWDYDGPGGPGWGVRQWVSRDWYGDASPVVNFSNNQPYPNDTINILTTIHNYGDVNYIDMPVNIYQGSMMIDSLRVDIPAQDSVVIATPFTQTEGSFTISVEVDKYNIKLELDEFNNIDSATIIFQCCHGIRGNVDGDISEIIDISDLVYLVDFMFTSGSAPACLDEGNIDGDAGNVIDISDLVALVDFMFTSGPSPADCP